MKLREIFRFEFVYLVRRLYTWLAFAVLLVAARLFVRGAFLSDATFNDYYLNAPLIIASTTVFTSVLWFIVAASVAGEAAARDAETGMDPLTYTAPVRKLDYLGGRFLAALAVNALILLAVPLGILVAVYTPGVDAEVVGPFRPMAYLTAYGFIALPNAFACTSIQFAWAALTRRAIASYVGSVLLFFGVYGTMFFLTMYVRQELAMWLDIFGHIYLTDDLVLGWTAYEKNTRLLVLEGPLLRSRLVWLGIALATLAFTYSRFRLVHPTVSPWLSRLTRRREAHAPTPGTGDDARRTVPIARARQTFGFATRARQTLAIARVSFRMIVVSRGGLVAMAAVAAIIVVAIPDNMQDLGSPVLPRTWHLLTFLTSALSNAFTPWVIIPLLTVFWAGELVWRERGAGLGEISDAAPVPEWVLFLGKLLGLALALALWMAFLAAAGVLVQARMGYHDYQLGLSLRVFFGLQLPEYLLFAVLALAVQGVLRHKYVGHFAALLAFVLIALSSWLGVGHRLLVYGASPGWSYSDMRGFGGSLGPWLWFKLYWVAWALLLAVGGRLLWMRGLEGGMGTRLRLARLRLTPATARAGALAVGLVLLLGGFVFYNTNVLNDFSSAAESAERSAEYERRYGRFASAPQPRLTRAELRVDIHPARRRVEIRGAYRLVNRGATAIDSIHLSTVPGVETGAITVDRPATPVLVDDELGYRVLALARPLQPGDSLRLGFEVRVQSRGFRNGGISGAVGESSSYFTNQAWLPSIGYQSSREIIGPADRREHGLAKRPLLPTLHDVEERGGFPRGERIAFEAVVGTDADQVAVAPGVLRRSWTEGGRRYFHYATDVPIGDEWAFFSGRYAVREVHWTPPGAWGHPVTIQLYHHPEHTANLDRILRSAQRSLAYNGEQFGPYPYSYLRLVENPARSFGAHAEPSMIDFGERYSLFDPQLDRRGLDFPFAVMGHEMGHQFCCPYAPVEGAGLLTESFGWYSAMGVVKAEYGVEHLRRLMRFFRQPYPIPAIRQAVPLTRGMDPYAAYRRGPFAFYALSEYVGEERVNLAFRRLREKYGPGSESLPTSLDLYRELQAVTPDSLQYLVHDLIAANTYWELETTRAAAQKTGTGWRVTLDVRARKVVVDSAGVETEQPMDERVQVGVFARTGQGSDFGETLYLGMHRIRSGQQTIAVTVPREPADAGIDPYHLLFEQDRFDNVERVEIERTR